VKEKGDMELKKALNEKNNVIKTLEKELELAKIQMQKHVSEQLAQVMQTKDAELS
jgi:predicted chitinase